MEKTLKDHPWTSSYGQKHVMLKPCTEHEWAEHKGQPYPTPEDRPGYMVKYDDGYISWSPLDVADAAYCPNGRLGFGHALNAIMEGKVATRVKWVHDDYLAAADIDEPNYRWITLGAGDSALVPNKFWNASTQAQANKNGGFLAVDPYLIHFNGTSVIMGWLPSHEDLIATDWFVADTVQDILVTAFGFLNTKQSDSEPVAE